MDWHDPISEGKIDEYDFIAKAGEHGPCTSQQMYAIIMFTNKLTSTTELDYKIEEN